ncbi:DUF3000 domain-containing protein [Streptacidiphilus monticola]|jgi:hypothetical protein|uniref:DUF3000 domain-containing protein n=1 Tax=Streptacidiphilus monticola TaxID=2161674 RepID=A0ABW1G2R4_9ACTN
MAAVSGRHPAQENSGEENTPAEFRAAVAALRATGVRPEVELADTPAPRKLAPYAFALEASVADEEGEELAGGRLVLLHEPDGHEAWDGRFRLVTLVRAELEPEMAHDPLLADVGWSWLMDALDQQGAQRTEPSGTVSRSSSHYFGALADRQASTEIEIRASWTPVGTDWAAHLRGWCELLCLCAGLPPTLPAPPSQQPGSVVPMPTRRRP